MKVELISALGTDLTVANAARVSFNAESDTLTDKDEKLIKYLAIHQHFTPFTHCVLTLRETVPLFVARQRFKHTVGFSYNEVSRRYVDAAPDFYFPDVWRKRSENKKQGSKEEEVEYSKDVKLDYAEAISAAVDTYNQLLKAGVCPEQARIVLPQSMYTSYYVTGSLAAYARAYKLRSAPDAQKEIREVAQYWDDICLAMFPVSWLALTKGS